MGLGVPAARRLIFCLVLIAVATPWPPARAARPGAGQGLILPLELNYGLIRSLMIRRIFNGPGRGKVLAGDCLRVRLWGPEIGAAPQAGQTRLVLRVEVVAKGKPSRRCPGPLAFSGYLEMWQRVELEPGGWRLNFRTVKTQLYDRRGRPAQAAEIVWRAIEGDVRQYIGGFSINLAETVASLTDRLPLLFQKDRQQEIRDWLGRITPGPLKVGRVGLRLDLLAPPPPLKPLAAKDRPPARPLTGDQLVLFQNYWQIWDSFLIREITALKGQPLSQRERDILLEVLLDQRHAFLRSLSRPGTGRDLVRRQFLQTWQRLAPIMRRHLLDDPSPHLLKLTAFFTASDALAILDRLGPELGLDISQEGLHRLAELVMVGRAPRPLDYHFRVNHELRALLGLPPTPLREPKPWPKLKRWRLPPLSWLPWAARQAHASGAPPDLHAEAMKWLPPQDRLEPYLDRMRRMLESVVDARLQQGELEPDRHQFFARLAAATAWQESCWRQFLDNGGQPAVLISYNRSSVGLMQVNELVWRGIYDRQRLRWSLRYNAAAGLEILQLYLRRYVLRRASRTARLGEAGLAGLVYALYNGGPSEFDPYLTRRRTGRLFISDRLFARKYQWVQKGQYDQVARCLLPGGAKPAPAR